MALAALKQNGTAKAIGSTVSHPRAKHCLMHLAGVPFASSEFFFSNFVLHRRKMKNKLLLMKRLYIDGFLTFPEKQKEWIQT